MESSRRARERRALQEVGLAVARAGSHGMPAGRSGITQMAPSPRSSRMRDCSLLRSGCSVYASRLAYVVRYDTDLRHVRFCINTVPRGRVGPVREPSTFVLRRFRICDTMCAVFKDPCPRPRRYGLTHDTQESQTPWVYRPVPVPVSGYSGYNNPVTA